jgi:hypothetical protein
MLSPEAYIEELKQDLISDPMRISAYHDMPYAMFIYPPDAECAYRKLIRLLAISLEQNYHRRVTFLSIGALLWQAIEATEGLDALVAEELRRGFASVQTTVQALLVEPEFKPLVQSVKAVADTLDPAKDILFLVRAAALAPDFYRGSVLMDELHANRVTVPVVLFYPGHREGRTDVRFMGLTERAGTGIYNYRVRIYGGNE